MTILFLFFLVGTYWPQSACRRKSFANDAPLDAQPTLQHFFGLWSELHLFARPGYHSPTEYYIWSGRGTLAEMTRLDLYKVPPAVFFHRGLPRC